MKKNPKKQATSMYDLKPHHVKMLRAMIANMIGKTDRWLEQGPYTVDIESLPDDLKIEAVTLKALQTIHRDGGVPTKDAVLQLLVALHGDGVRNPFAVLSEEYTDDGDVFSLASALNEWSQWNSLLMKLRGATSIVAEMNGTIEENFAYVIEEIMSVKPVTSGRFNAVDRSQLIDDYLEWQHEMHLKQKGGEAVGPSFPWKGLRNRIPYVKDGDVILFSAETKFGKSTFADLIAEYQAYMQGYRVLLFHLETSQKSLAARVLSRKLMIPMKAMDTGFIDLKDPLYAKPIKQIQNGWKQQKGSIEYIWCPEATIEDIAERVEAEKAIAATNGLKISVIADYLTKVRWDVYDRNSKWNAIGIAAQRFKDQMHSMDVPAIMFAQDGIEENGKRADQRKISVFGGQTVSHASQAHVRILRNRNAPDDVPYKSDGLQVADKFNQPVYMHRKGQPGSNITLHTVLANDYETGYDDDIAMINGFFKIIQVDPHGEMVPQN